MKPIPPAALITLILALCGLCIWQWQREAALRRINQQHTTELVKLQAEHTSLTARATTANAEILRLTGTLNELRNSSISTTAHDEALAARTSLQSMAEKQNAAITQQNQAIQQANETIQKLTTERASLARRLNEVTAKYNAVIRDGAR